MNSEFSKRCIQLAGRLADAARNIVLQHYRTDVAVEVKPDQSPVTAADRDVEAELRRLITAEFPDHGIVGEEYSAYQSEAEYVWVLDPIDGTKAFICGIPVFGTLIGLAQHGKPILGVIDQPVLRERWIGGVDYPTMLNDRPVRTRACKTWDSATVCATTPDMFTGRDQKSFQRVQHETKWVRYGTDCYAYGLLATGLVDLVIEADVKVHDYIGPAAVIAGAGGLVTDWTGASVDLNTPTDHIIAAGDSAMQKQALAFLGGD
ncbi:MAG: histidinol-phosphatase [Gammaproteobacteria bacterium]|nr:histidinol-phosphatase [Gammaproteobacteria bacterium]